MAEAFSQDISKFIKKTDAKLVDFLREFAQDLGQSFVELMPVKTGFARASWYGTIGDSPIPNPSPPTAAPNVPNKAFATFTATLANLKATDTIWMSNSAAYILALEYGSSKKAPEGMVRITLSRAEQIASDVLKRIKA